MGMVMVPVPEEHVEEFNRYLFGLMVVRPDRVTAEACVAARDSLDVQHQRLLDALCRAALLGGSLSYAEAAAEVGVPVEQILQLAVEINHAFQRQGGPPTVINDSEVITRDDGSTAVQPILLVLGSVAEELRTYVS